jgi:hypothetical protein
MARPRDYKAETQRRNVLARKRGFRSYAEQRKFGRPRNQDDLLQLPERARESRGGALEVRRLALTKRMSPEEAAARLAYDINNARWWIPESFGPRRCGVTTITRRSPLELRPVTFADSSRTEFVAVRGWKRDEVERIFAIQWRAAHGLATTEELEWLRGRKVGGRPVADTKEQLHEIARRGEIDPVEAYRSVVS